MTDRNKTIMSWFSLENSWEQNYKKIIELGKSLPPFPEESKQDRWLIKACQSPLWLKPERGPAGELIFTGDSEALISKGLLAIIIFFYTNKKPEEILRAKPLFIERLGLSQYLSSRRTNGLNALLQQVLHYAKAFSLLFPSADRSPHVKKD